MTKTVHKTLPADVEDVGMSRGMRVYGFGIQGCGGLRDVRSIGCRGV